MVIERLLVAFVATLFLFGCDELSSQLALDAQASSSSQRPASSADDTDHLISEDDITKIVRFTYQGQESYGLVTGGTSVQRFEGDLFDDPVMTDEVIPLDEVQLLPPTAPSKVIAVGLNFRSHSGSAGAAAPGLFAKFPSSLAGQDDPIWMFPDASNLHYEGELVVVIGKTARNVSVEDASGYILGVTAGNDVTERVWQRSDLQWVRGKGADSFAPVGPYIVTGLDYNDLLVETRLNGETRQSESTANMIHSVDDIVSYISRYITLEPGDLIFTGTPGSTGGMQIGDVVEVEVEGVGILRNTVQEWTP
ncbi:MAG: fumarylacetoacetate hydrolase family protein [Chloroflexota bacterium]